MARTQPIQALTETRSSTESKFFMLRHYWTIEHFSFFIGERSLESSPFSAEGYEGIVWTVILYPDTDDQGYEGALNLALRLQSSDRSELRVKAKFTLLNSMRKEIVVRADKRPFAIKEGERWSVLNEEGLPRTLELLGESGEDTLTVRCEMTVLMDTVNTPSEIISRAISRIPTPCDVVLDVNGMEYPAHKAILGARSLPSMAFP